MMISECCTKEKPLLRRAQSGDPDAIELFLAGYVPLLRALAKRFFCVSLSVQDLCQAGYIGLMRSNITTQNRALNSSHTPCRGRSAK